LSQTSSACVTPSHLVLHSLPTRRSSDLLGGKPSGLDRVVHALEPRDVDHPDAVAAHQQARRVQPLRKRVIAAARDRLRSPADALDRKSTRLNSSHQIISYAVFCLKQQNK